MSVVLVGPAGGLGSAVIERLLAQGDEVRLIEDDPAAAEGWKKSGAFVAVADEWDEDLIERVAMGARTIVVFDLGAKDGLLEAILAAAERSSVDRLIVLSSKPRVPPLLADTKCDYVVLGYGKRSLFDRAPAVDDQRLAEAIDAADDIQGPVRLALDLTDASSWARLGL